MYDIEMFVTSRLVRVKFISIIYVILKKNTHCKCDSITPCRTAMENYKLL